MIWVPALSALSALAFLQAIAAPVTSIPLPSVRGRIDHLSCDSASGRIFIAALGNNTVEVVDIGQGKVVHTITGLDGPQGVVYVPKWNRVFVANGGDGTVRIFNGQSFSPAKVLDFHEDADNLRYDPGRNRVYVGYGSGALAALDADSGKVTWDIKLPGHPESFQYEKTGTRIFVNIPDAGEIAIVDWKLGKITAHWSAPGLKANFPMALDESRHRLLIGFRQPPVLGIFDTESGNLLWKEPIHGDADEVFLDADGKRIYVVCGGGYLDRVREVEPDRYQKLVAIPTAAGARTGFLDQARNTVYLAIPKTWRAGAGLRIIPLN